MSTKEQYITADEFKAKCMSLLDQVQAGKTELIVTKHGKPVVKLVPFEPLAPALFGCMKGSVVINGDIVESLNL